MAAPKSSELDRSPHSVTLWGSAGYFERLVAHCCWHICMTLLKLKKKCGLAFQAHWKHPGPVSNHSWCGNIVLCYNLIQFGMWDIWALYAQTRTHGAVQQRGEKIFCAGFVTESQRTHHIWKPCFILIRDTQHHNTPLEVNARTCCLSALDSRLVFQYVVRLLQTTGRQI